MMRGRGMVVEMEMGQKGEGGKVMMCWHLKVPGESAGEGGGERKPLTSGKHTDIWSMKERKGEGDSREKMVVRGE